MKSSEIKGDCRGYIEKSREDVPRNVEAAGFHRKIESRAVKPSTLVRYPADQPELLMKTLKNPKNNPFDTIGINLGIDQIDPCVLHDPHYDVRLYYSHFRGRSGRRVYITPRIYQPITPIVRMRDKNDRKHLLVCGGGTSREALRRAKKRIRKARIVSICMTKEVFRDSSGTVKKDGYFISNRNMAIAETFENLLKPKGKKS